MIIKATSKYGYGYQASNYEYKWGMSNILLL